MKKMSLLLLFSICFAFGGEIEWHSFNTGYKKAVKEKKPIVIDFYADWCKWCKVMEKKTFTDPKVVKKLKKEFICIRIDTEDMKDKIEFEGKTFSPTQFLSAFGARGLPTVVFMDDEGKPITMIPGFIDAQRFLSLLGYMKDECYKQQVTLEEYMEKKKCK